MQKKVLIIGYIYPEPTTNAAGVRMMQLIDFFVSQNFEVTFSTTAEKTPFSFDLKKIGVAEVPIQLNSSTFNKFIDKLQPEIVVFDRFFTEEQFGWRVAENCPDALKILDTEDLHFLRKSREEAIFNPKNTNKNLVFREISSLLKCDLSLIISKKEMEILTEDFRIQEDILWYLPLFSSPEEILKPFDERNQHIVFAGNFKHTPNTDAVLYIRQIWKELSTALPSAEMHIYGAYAPPEISGLHNPREKFFIEGHVENLKEILRNARLMLAPLRFGAGLKGKLLEAMQCGLPCVTTAIGTEGIVDDNTNGSDFIAETQEEIIQKCTILFTEKNAWEKSQKQGIEILNTRFDKAVFEENFLEKISLLTKNISQHREKNFMGRMLEYHQNQSSKYLGKWIEEKNKNLKN